MISLQQEIRNFFSESNISYEDCTNSLYCLDFRFRYREDKEEYAHLEVKEKKAPYNLSNWGIFNEKESDIFIIDDLSIRKLMLYGPRSFTLIRNNGNGKYYMLRSVDTLGIPKIRVNRPIEKNNLIFKGKWIIKFSDLKPIESLSHAFLEILKYINNLRQVFLETTECFGNYPSEKLSEAGIVREAHYWQKDLFETH